MSLIFGEGQEQAQYGSYWTFSIWKDLESRELNVRFLGDGIGRYPTHQEIALIESVLQELKTLSDEEINDLNLEAYKRHTMLISSGEKSQERKAVPGFVYIIKSKKYYKIGRSIDSKKRFKSYLTENPNKVSLIMEINVGDSLGCEKFLHEIFKEKRHSREWFLLNKSDLKNIPHLIDSYDKPASI